MDASPDQRTSPTRWRQVVSIGALAAGLLLFAITVRSVDLDQALAAGWRFGMALPLALVASGLTHLTRTWAWSWCFARPGALPFLRLLRVRLAAEALSYLTVSGMAGDPLKVVLVGDRIPGREATAAVALERITYIVGTVLVVGAAAAVALATQPLSPGWATVYRAFAIGSGAMAAGIALIVIRRDSYVLSAFRAADRARGGRVASSKAGRFAADVGRQLRDLLRGDRRRLGVLLASTVIGYACMAAEAWLVLRAVGVPISFSGALALETLTRVASFASVMIPANLGALEAANVAAATAVGLGAGGAPLALARRLRGLFWAGLGLALYPRSALRERRTESDWHGPTAYAPPQRSRRSQRSR